MTWKEYFKLITKTVALKSKDPNTKVGCIIVDEEKRIISTGFNGFPAGMIETDEMWERPLKYIFCVHGENNAIVYAKRDLRNTELYSTLEPCAQCAKLICSAGIKKVYFFEERPEDGITRKLFHLNNVKWEII